MKKFSPKAGWCVILIIITALVSFPISSGGAVAEEPVREAEEYELKAALLYNFLLSIDWPKEIFKNPGDTFIIGIYGDNPFGNKLDKVAAKATEDNRKIALKYFKENTSSQVLRQCQLLFIAPFSRDRMKKLLDELKDYPVLTVSEVNGFIHLGGMINFVIVKDRVRFEINKAAADHAGIMIRSRLLKRALNIIGEDHAK